MASLVFHLFLFHFVMQCLLGTSLGYSSNVTDSCSILSTLSLSLSLDQFVTARLLPFLGLLINIFQDNYEVLKSDDNKKCLLLVL